MRYADTNESPHAVHKEGQQAYDSGILIPVGDGMTGSTIQLLGIADMSYADNCGTPCVVPAEERHIVQPH